MKSNSFETNSDPFGVLAKISMSCILLPRISYSLNALLHDFQKIGNGSYACCIMYCTSAFV